MAEKKSEAVTAELVEQPKGGPMMEQMPSFIERGDATGKEDIQLSELRLPRLGIAQGLSPQMLPNKSEYIKDLRLGEMFNDMTSEIYGDGPLRFIPLKREVRRIEFIPRDEGGGVRDLNVPADDPRNEWTEDAEGNRLPPVATRFTEFVCLLLREGGGFEPIVVSIKETNKWMVKAAKDLTTYIALRNAPIYAGVYEVQTKMESNEQGTFGIFKFRNAGVVQEQALYLAAKDYQQSLSGKTIHIQRAGVEEDAASFDTSKF
jgi:hypothetical protein